MVRRKVQHFLEKVVSSKPAQRFVRSNEKLKYLPALAFFRQKFYSHPYGMVGFIKQLIDEFSGHGGKARVLFSMIEIYGGQVFVFKKAQAQRPCGGYSKVYGSPILHLTDPGRVGILFLE